jgi:ketosteroid isomerase-like protein
VAVEFHDLQTVTGDSVAAVHAFVTFRGLSAEEEELYAVNNRLTWVLRKTSGGEWKVIHEHTSSPADVDTGRLAV